MLPAHGCGDQGRDAEESEDATEDKDAAIDRGNAGEKEDRVLIQPEVEVFDVHIARENGVQQGHDRVEASCQKGDSDDYESPDARCLGGCCLSGGHGTSPSVGMEGASLYDWPPPY